MLKDLKHQAMQTKQIQLLFLKKIIITYDK